MSEVSDYWKPELEKAEQIVRAQGYQIASMAAEIEKLQDNANKHLKALTLLEKLEAVDTVALGEAIFTAAQTIEGYVPMAFGNTAIGKCLNAATTLKSLAEQMKGEK